MKSWTIALVLAFVAIAPIFYIVYHYGDVKPQEPSSIATVEFQTRPQVLKLETGVTLDVLACKVVDGYKFGLYVEGNKWITAHLSVATKEEAIPLVIDWLNATEPPPPTVTLLRKVGDYWIVDFHITHEGQRVSMVNLLRSKGLLLDR